MRLMDGRRNPARTRNLIRLYPSAWRARYGAEMLDLLEERPPTWRDAIDLIRCAIDAHLHPPTASRLPAFAAILAGAAWTVVALAVLAEPVPPDWPGFLAWTLVPGLIGAVAGLIASLGLALRLGDVPGPLGRVAVAAVIVTHGAWAVWLLMAILGSGYGAATAATGTAAAIATILLGLVLVGRDEHPFGEALVVIGGALLLPPPLAWVVVAVAWTAIGVWLMVDRARWSDRLAA
jgi:hypothetical protein